MENYDILGTIGEGTYGVVLKGRHKPTNQIVAIKRFKESEKDEQVRKTATREIKILKQLKHDNIVNLLQVFRSKGKIFLVFEYVDCTILEEIERHPNGLEKKSIKRLMWQLVRALEFCHQHDILHRDVKPENLLVSRNGVLKLCDFGFARSIASAGQRYTEYVSTRWYRAPELLVGDVSYGKAVDVWALGCMLVELSTGMPLFPGDSDIDQLHLIMKCLGRITLRQQELFQKHAMYHGMRLAYPVESEPLEVQFPTLDKVALDFLRHVIHQEPLDRWTCTELLRHPYFSECGEDFEKSLHESITKELEYNKISSGSSRSGNTRGNSRSRTENNQQYVAIAAKTLLPETSAICETSAVCMQTPESHENNNDDTLLRGSEKLPRASRVTLSVKCGFNQPFQYKKSCSKAMPKGVSAKSEYKYKVSAPAEKKAHHLTRLNEITSITKQSERQDVEKDKVITVSRQAAMAILPSQQSVYRGKSVKICTSPDKATTLIAHRRESTHKAKQACSRD